MKKLFFIVMPFLFPLALSSQSQWEEVFLRYFNSDEGPVYYCVMSELEPVDPFEGMGQYSGQNLFDNNPATAWVEGEKGYGKGIVLYVSPGENFIESMVIRNGYQKSDDLYTRNSRVKNLKLTLLAGYFIEGQVTEIESVYHARQMGQSKTILLADVNDVQRFGFPWKREEVGEAKKTALDDFRKEFKFYLDQVREMCPTCAENPDFKLILKLEIVDVYPGSTWDDTCISDLILFTTNPERDKIAENDEVEKVYESPDNTKILINTTSRKGIILVDKVELPEYSKLGEEEYLDISLMDVSPDKEWAQVDLMFSEEGAGRVEEYSVLYHVRSLTRVHTTILETMYGMYGFTKKSKKIYLDTSDGLVDLDEILDKIKNQ